MEYAIEIEHLSKSFGPVQAVRDLSFSVKAGELFAFLGVNGAGKSTTISILCGQLKKDGGRVKVCGEEIGASFARASRRLGVVFQNSVLDQALSVKDNLKSRAALYGICGKQFDARLKELSALLDFSDLLGRSVGKLSGGQRRRIDIARALIHKPSILVLDEPTTGLDPQTRKLLWDVITDLRCRESMTVLLTTHYMEEAAEADTVLIIDGGMTVAQGTPHELKTAYTGDFLTLYGVTDEEAAVLSLPFERVQDAVRVMVPSTEAATELIVKHPTLFRDFELTKGKMDDVFLAVTGKKLTQGEQADKNEGGAK